MRLTEAKISFHQSFEYDFEYLYNGSKPHQIDQILNSTNNGNPLGTKFTYNASGSVQTIAQKDFGGGNYTDTEEYVHNEEQLLMGYHNVAENTYAHFVYDHTGNRILKGSLSQAMASVDGQTTGANLTVDPYTIYVNPYYVEQPFNALSLISKHYYMGMQRIATNMGDGERPIEDPELGKTNPQTNKTNALLNNLVQILTDFGAQEGVDFTREDLTQTPNFTDYYPQDSSATVATKTNIPGNTTTVHGPTDPGDPMPPARLMYYYHPDYLGNVEYITDMDGLPYQYFFYSPWGEALADQKAYTNPWSSPYQFNGKELDEESGLYYYGARYYNPQVSVWLGVDPLHAKSPNQTPYHFVSNNPIMRIDPDGLTDFELFKNGRMKPINENRF